MGRAPGGSGDLSEAELARLPRQLLPQIEVPGPLPLDRRAAALHDLRTYFITVAAYADAAVHYNIRSATPRLGPQALDAASENPSRGAAPSRMKECHGFSRCHQVYRDTIGNGYGEQNSRPGGNPAIHAIHLDPAAAGIEGHDLDTVHLLAQRGHAKVAQLPAERAPAGHHLTNRRVTPEAEIKPAARSGPAARDAGDDSVLFAPTRNLEPRDISWNGGFSDLERC